MSVDYSQLFEQRTHVARRFGGIWDIPVRLRYRDVLRPLIRDGSRVLEIGVGCGGDCCGPGVTVGQQQHALRVEGEGLAQRTLGGAERSGAERAGLAGETGQPVAPTRCRSPGLGRARCRRLGRHLDELRVPACAVRRAGLALCCGRMAARE